MTTKPLLIAGRSSHMGTRKELCLIDDDPLYMHLLTLLHDACPESEAAYLSLRDRRAAEELRTNPHVTKSSGDVLVLDPEHRSLAVRMLFDHEEKFQADDNHDIGPAAGLLAAYRQDPKCNWLVVACDYPLVTGEALVLLRREFEARGNGNVTCFRKEEGIGEPLLAVWTPRALRKLEDNVRDGVLRPCVVVSQMHGMLIPPRDERWLFHINTREEWQKAVQMNEEAFRQRGLACP